MSAEAISSLILAAVAVLGSIGSVLLLAFRVGAISGKIDARMTSCEQDRSNMWKAIDVVTGRFNRHMERQARSRRGD